MDKSVISTLKENIELAASKYDSISVHLNALRQRVLGSGRTADSPNPLTPQIQTNEQEAKEIKYNIVVASNESRNSELKSTKSDEFGFCDANSGTFEDNIGQDTDSTIEDEDGLCTDLLTNKLQESKSMVNTNELGTEEIEKKIAGDSGCIKDVFSNVSLISSSTDFTSSDEDEENIYSELLKRLENEEAKRSLNVITSNLQNTEEVSGTTSDNSSCVGSGERAYEEKAEFIETNKNLHLPTSVSKRTQEIMESIEENNEEWEALGKQLNNGDIDNISFDKLFSHAERNSDTNIKEDISKPPNSSSSKHLPEFIIHHTGIERENEEQDNKSIKTKKINSKLSISTSIKSNNKKILGPKKRVSLDYLNSTFSDAASIKAKSVVSSKKNKIISKKTETKGREKISRKKLSSIPNYSSKKDLKELRSTKMKPIGSVQRKSSIANQRCPKNSKLTNNITKTVFKNTVHKHIQNQPLKPKRNNIHSPNKNFKNDHSKSENLTKRKASPEKNENEIKTIFSSDEIKKQIEPLIKSRPDNIFLKKEFEERINEASFNDDKGSGDGLDKVRSQAIINSMNQSINKSNRSFVPSHFMKSDKKRVIGPSSTLQPLKLKQLNKVDAQNVLNASKIPANKNVDLSFKKTSIQSALKTIEPSNQGSVHHLLSAHNKANENKRAKSREEATIINPKEILAQLEQEVNLNKLQENENDKNDYIIDTLGERITSKAQKTAKKNDLINIKNTKADKNNSNIGNRLETYKMKCRKEGSKPCPPEHSEKLHKQPSSKLDENSGEKCNKIKLSRKQNISNAILSTHSKSEIYHSKKNEMLRNENLSNETISRIQNKMLTLNFEDTKPKITNFPFILGQSTSKSYNIQANVQQTLSIMMMLPSESVRRTLSVETKVSSKASTQTALTTQSRQVKCPACVLKKDQDEDLLDVSEDDPWDTEYTGRNFVRCTCIPRNTVSFKTVMKQLLSETSIGSLIPISETSTLYEESNDKNDENKQLSRRSDLSHLTKLLHATQRIRERLVT